MSDQNSAEELVPEENDDDEFVDFLDDLWDYDWDWDDEEDEDEDEE